LGRVFPKKCGILTIRACSYFEIKSNKLSLYKHLSSIFLRALSLSGTIFAHYKCRVVFLILELPLAAGKPAKYLEK